MLMPLAPSFSFLVALVDNRMEILLTHRETFTGKKFILAPSLNPLKLKEHMESLTESQCEQFIAVKTPKGKKTKVDSPA